MKLKLGQKQITNALGIGVHGEVRVIWAVGLGNRDDVD
jgi:hypothetical protein